MKKYKKLCKNTDFLGKKSRVLLAEDHIIVCSNIMGSEEYRRFFFKDLQYITIYKTLSGRINNIVILFVLFCLGLLCSLLHYFSGNDISMPINGVFAIISVIFIIALLINTIKGTTSKTIITTLNSQETITLSGRFKKTKKVIDSIRANIVESQGDFTQKALAEKLQSTIDDATNKSTALEGSNE